jgi:CHASE2 domain-containing sensor protein
MDSQEIRPSFSSIAKDPDADHLKKYTQHKLHLLRQLLQKHKHQALLELMDRQAKEIEVTAKQIHQFDQRRRSQEPPEVTRQANVTLRKVKDDHHHHSSFERAPIEPRSQSMTDAEMKMKVTVQ